MTTLHQKDILASNYIYATVTEKMRDGRLESTARPQQTRGQDENLT